MRRTIMAVLVLLSALVVAPQRVGAAPPDRVDALGTASDLGSPELAPGHLAVGIADGPGDGYWVASDDGGVFSFGAPFHGSAGGVRLAAPIVGIAASPDLAGYWLASADGGVFSYGSARFLGSLGGIRLAAPIVGIAASPAGGYWLTAADGGVFAFGNARYEGGLAGAELAAPVVGIAASPKGGYWLAAADGGVFSFGNAHFAGSAGGLPLQAPVTAIAPSPSGDGYRLAARDGGVFTYGDATFEGAGAGGEPVTAIATSGASGYRLLHSPLAPFPPLPAGSGRGRRIVYSNPQQRVWLVDGTETVVRSYLVSGRFHVPAAGTYSVYSKSEHAYAGHDDITMDFMVRFARAASGIPIGFHGIPRRGGVPMQTNEDLGGFRSSGCVRQSEEDASHLFTWAPIGTPVIVLW